MAEAPTSSGQDLKGRGNEKNTTGRVNRGSRGTDRAEAIAITPSISGNNITDTTMIGMVEPRRCFLSVHELMSNVTKKYTLLQNWYNLSLHRPASMANIGTLHFTTVVFVSMVIIMMWTTDSSRRECIVLCQICKQNKQLSLNTSLISSKLPHSYDNLLK